jgi:hypothetical protein
MAHAIKAAYYDFPTQPRILLIVRQFSEQHPAFSQGAI